jgi:hypothetical protein
MSVLHTIKATSRGRNLLWDYMEADGIRWPSDSDASLQQEYLIEIIVDLLHAGRAMEVADLMERVSDTFWADVQSEQEGD